MQGISQHQAQSLQADPEATQQKLSNEDFQTATGWRAALQHDPWYFALNNVQDQIAQTRANSVGYRAQGARMSAMEHLVPERMFSAEQASANGIRAVKAIQLAAAEGQKIYTITQANLSIALQQLQLSSEIKTDIRNAVNAGMEVTAHQQPANFFGSQSVGCILLDPNTGRELIGSRLGRMVVC